MATPSSILSDLPPHLRDAVRFSWQTRTKQLEKQAGSGTKDQGLRSAVAGGAQMDGLISLLTRLVIEAGIDRSHVFYNESLELSGCFRFAKEQKLQTWSFRCGLNQQAVA